VSLQERIMRFFKTNGLRAFGAIILMSLYSSNSAHAWTLLYESAFKVGGSTMSVTVNRTNCPSGIDGWLEKAAELWSAIDTSYLEIKIEGDSSATASNIYNYELLGFSVVCDTNFGTTTGADPNSAIAVGGSWIDESGNLAKGGVIINLQGTVFTDLDDNQKINSLAHELGHVLGFGHSSDPAAVLYFSSRPNGARTGLGQDDIEAMTYLYPRNEFSGATSGSPYGCGTLGRGNGDTGPRAFLGFLLWVVLMWFCGRALRSRRPTHQS